MPKSRLRRMFAWLSFTKVVVLSTLGLVAIIVSAWIGLAALSNGKIVEVAEQPSAEVAIVPGARVRSNGRPTLALRQRLDAAALLYQQGAVSHVLVSGDNGQEHYNEPVAMQQYLRDLGLPAEAITLDYAGFDTWDTCLRASEQFGVCLLYTSPSPRDS